MKSILLFASIVFTALPASAAGLYTHGHGDVRAYCEGGQLRMRYQLDYSSLVDGAEVGTFESGPVSFALSSLVTQIPEPPRLFPDGLLDAQPELSVLGVGVNEPLWYIPEVQEFDRPWLGFSSEELNLTDWSHPVSHNPGELKLDLVSVSGPAGSYFTMMYSVDPGNTTFIHFATFDGIDGNDTYKLGSPTDSGFPAGMHSHVNWFFTQPGLYDVTMRFSGDHVTDGYSEVTGTVTFAVVPEPGCATLALSGGLLLLRRRSSSSRARWFSRRH